MFLLKCLIGGPSSTSTRCKKGSKSVDATHPYFYFSGGEATDWLDRTVNAHSLSRLSFEQWMAEFERLKKLNKDILGAPARKESAEAGRAAVKRPRGKR
jgi:hypothetical protein